MVLKRYKYIKIIPQLCHFPISTINPETYLSPLLPSGYLKENSAKPCRTFQPLTPALSTSTSVSPWLALSSWHFEEANSDHLKSNLSTIYIYNVVCVYIYIYIYLYTYVYYIIIIYLYTPIISEASENVWSMHRPNDPPGTFTPRKLRQIVRKPFYLGEVVTKNDY